MHLCLITREEGFLEYWASSSHAKLAPETKDTVCHAYMISTLDCKITDYGAIAEAAAGHGDDPPACQPEERVRSRFEYHSCEGSRTAAHSCHGAEHSTTSNSSAVFSFLPSKTLSQRVFLLNSHSQGHYNFTHVTLFAELHEMPHL